MAERSAKNSIAQQPDRTFVRRELCRRSFRYFIRAAFPHVDPNVALADGWYIDAIADHLEAVKLAMLGKPGGIRRLVINIQARSLKSTITGVMFPAWCWLSEPWLPWLTAARSQALAIRDSTKTRKLIDSVFYQDLISLDGVPEWTFAEDQNQKGDFLNSANGRRTATFRGGGTGYGGRGLIADDILSIDDRFSALEIDHANNWLETEFFTRQNDPTRTAIVLNMHRLTTDDPSARAIAHGWEHLCLPTEYDPTDCKRATSIGWVDPRTEPGESLNPERWTPQVIAEDKAHLQEFYETICNQRPRNRTGAVLKDLADLPRYKVLPVNARRRVSIDPSFKGFDITKPKAKRSRVGIVDAHVERAKIFITALTVDFMDFDRLVAETKAAALRNPGAAIYVEDEANGPALKNRLEDEVVGIEGVNPGAGVGGGSKLERFIAVAHFLRGGNVLFPEDTDAPWVRAFIARILAYPSVEWDDDIDALTQLLRMEFLVTGGTRHEERERESAIERWRRRSG